MIRRSSAIEDRTRRDPPDTCGVTPGVRPDRSRSMASALKMKADLLDAIRSEIEEKNYTQRQLVKILDEYQPAVSNLIRGRIAQVSLEKLLRYADRLGMRITVKIFPARRAATTD